MDNLDQIFFVYISSICLWAYVHIGAEMVRDWRRGS